MKAEILMKLSETTAPFYLGKLKSILEANGKWFVGNKLSWADLEVANYLQLIVQHGLLLS